MTKNDAKLNKLFQKILDLENQFTTLKDKKERFELLGPYLNSFQGFLEMIIDDAGSKLTSLGQNVKAGVTLLEAMRLESGEKPPTETHDASCPHCEAATRH